MCINKIDRKDARPDEVLDEIYDLLIDLDATDKQLDFPLLYAIGKQGIAKRTLDDENEDLVPLFETILKHVPPPSYRLDMPFQMLVSDLSYSDYLGRLAIGKVFNGSVGSNESLICVNERGEHISLKVTKLQVYEGLNLREIDRVEPGIL